MRMLNSKGAIAAGMVSLAVWAQPVGAQDVRIVSMVLGDGLQQADHSGFYGELMDAFLAALDHPAEFDVLPFKRALKVFLAGEADCMWALDAAFLRGFGATEDKLIESALVLHSRQYLFATPGTPKLGDLADLAGKSIGVLNGANTETSLAEADADVVKLSTQEAKIQMLMAGRLDVIGGWTPDIYITLHKLGEPAEVIEPIFTLSSSGVRIVCRDQPDTQAFLAEVDTVIPTVLRSASYHGIAARYGVPDEGPDEGPDDPE